jgi:hypothetical protein
MFLRVMDVQTTPEVQSWIHAKPTFPIPNTVTTVTMVAVNVFENGPAAQARVLGSLVFLPLKLLYWNCDLHFVFVFALKSKLKTIVCFVF